MTLWTVAHQAPRSRGFSRQEYWSGLPCPPPGDLPDPGKVSCTAGRFFTAEPPGKTPSCIQWSSVNKWTEWRKQFPKEKSQRMVAGQPNQQTVIFYTCPNRSSRREARKAQLLIRFPRWGECPARFQNHHLGKGYDQIQIQIHFLRSCCPDLSFSREEAWWGWLFCTPTWHWSQGTGVGRSDLGPALTGPGVADGTSKEQVWCHTTCKEALHNSEKEVRQVLTSASPGHTCRVCDQEELRLYWVQTPGISSLSTIAPNRRQHMRRPGKELCQLVILPTLKMKNPKLLQKLLTRQRSQS